MKKLLIPVFNRIARALGIIDIQSRLDRIESHFADRRVSDSLYSAIEDRFRGDPQTIKLRQSSYLEHMNGIPTGLPVLDLGSGRGEWLEVLRERAVTAEGVDSNQEFVSSARARGLSVTHDDIITHLRNRPASSVSAVTMFQVAEHLPLGVLEHTLALVHRVIAAGGLLIVEIPNIETLRVGAATFWIDPTHERPLFPEFLAFMIERAGFTNLRRVTSTALSQAPTGLSEVEQQMHERINGHGDFAVIATR